MSSERPDLDAAEILRRLVARGVDSVVIGGIAAVLHGSSRSTFDLDVCFATDDANLTALGEVLVGLGARLRGVEEEDLPFVADAAGLRRVELLTLRTDCGDLDVVSRPSGMRSFAALRAAADRYDLGDVAVLVAAIPDLIAMKRAAGRPKDAADIAELEAILRLRGR